MKFWVKYLYVKGVASDGKRSLCLDKTEKCYFPIAQWFRTFPYANAKQFLEVGVKVKAVNVTKAIIDVVFLDANDQMMSHEWAVYIGQKEDNDPIVTHDWKLYEAVVAIPKDAKQIAIGLQIYGPGKGFF